MVELAGDTIKEEFDFSHSFWLLAESRPIWKERKKKSKEAAAVITAAMSAPTTEHEMETNGNVVVVATAGKFYIRGHECWSTTSSVRLPRALFLVLCACF